MTKMQRLTTPLFVLLLLLWAVGCRAVPPRFEHRTAAGSAFSDDERTAHRLAVVAQELAPQVAGRLGLVPEPPFVIHHAPAQLSRSDAALIVTRSWRNRIIDVRIVLGDTFVEEHTAYGIAHELTHWYMHHSVWRRLPIALEEGLAELIAMELAPQSAVDRRLGLGTTLLFIDSERHAQVLAARRSHFERDSRKLGEDLYAVGWDVVQRLGVATLRELCLRAEAEGLREVPLEWIEAALVDARCPACSTAHPWILSGELPAAGESVTLEPMLQPCSARPAAGS